MKFLKKLSDAVVNGLENGFYRYGQLLANRPVLFIIVPLLICGLCGVGLLRWHEETAGEKLWVPQDSDFVRDNKWIQANFQVVNRFQTVLFVTRKPGTSVLTKQTLLDMLDLYEKINATTAQYKDKNDEEKTISWDEACLKIPTPNGPRCTERSILEIYRYDRTIIEKLKDEDIFQTVNSTFTSPIYGSNFDYLTTLGKPVKNDQDSQIGAEALRMRWMIQIDVGQLTGDEKTERVDKATLAWESAFVDTVDAFTKESEKESEVFQNAARSFMDATADAILGDLQLLFGGYVLVFIYVILVLGRRNLVEIRAGLALAGLASIGLGILLSYGLSSGLGIFFGPLHQILPFLLLGIGIDNMFVIVQCYENLDDDEKLEPLDVRIGKTMKHAGAAITVTSGTDFAAFAIGASTILPALQSFCLYAAIGILGLYFLQCTFFTAWFVLDVKRVESNRNGILCCCYKHGRDYKPSECSKKDLTNVIFDKVIAQNMVKLPVKVLVLMAALGLLGANIYGFTQLEQKFDPIWFVPESSLARQFSNAADEQFPSGGQVGSVYFTSLNYFQDIPKIERIQRNLLDSKNARIGSIDSWATDFFLFINTTAEEYDKNPMSKEKFSETMWSFLCDSPYGFAVRNSFLFNNSLDCLNTGNPVIEDIQASVLNYQYDSMSGSAIQIEAMRTTKEIIANEQLVSVEPEAEVGAFAFSPAFGNWITDEVIGDELLRNMLLALLCVLIMTLILIASIPTCLMVLLCVILTLVDVIGTMHFWGLTLDTVSCVILVIAIGLCVDYSAHMGHTFMTLAGDRKTRVRVTIEEIGPAVFHGGFSTFIAFVLLSGSESYVFTTFFKIFFCVVLFGMFHGLFFLPVLLSFLGPAPYATAEDAGDKEETIRNHSGYRSSGRGHPDNSKKRVKGRDQGNPRNEFGPSTKNATPALQEEPRYSGISNTGFVEIPL